MSANDRNITFNFSYTELINLSFEKEGILTRDVANLIQRGITAARISNFVNLRNDFIAILPDATMLAIISGAKQQRDDAANLLRIAMKEVQGIAANTFGKSSAQYKAFASKSLSLLDAEGLYMFSFNIVILATKFMTDMSHKGLTAAMLTDIGTLASDVKTKIINFTEATGNQLLTTQNRRHAANALYIEMMAMCETAIVYYQDRNPLIASEYFVYNVGGMQQRNGVVQPNSIIGRNLDGITEKSVFKMKATGGNNLLMYFSNTEAGNEGAIFPNIPANADNYTILTAAQLGFDSKKGFKHFCIKNDGNAETGYRVVVE